jgi:hypothetical protein
MLMLYTQTAFSQAIFKMFDNLDDWLTEQYTDLPDNAISVYLFGGCAMHLHTGARTSNDVDAELRKIKKLTLQEIAIKPVVYRDEKGLPKSLFFDGNFDTSIASLDPGYEDRAILLRTTKSKLVSLYLVSPVDLAVSKLGRLEVNDRCDINTLYQRGLFTEQEFIEAATEALSYYPLRPDGLRFNIQQAIDLIREEA